MLDEVKDRHDPFEDPSMNLQLLWEIRNNLKTLYSPDCEGVSFSIENIAYPEDDIDFDLTRSRFIELLEKKDVFKELREFTKSFKVALMPVVFSQSDLGEDVLIESLYAVGKVTLIPELVEVVREELSGDGNTVQCNYSADRLECAAEGAWRSMYEIEKERLFFSTSKGIWLTKEMERRMKQTEMEIPLLRSKDCIAVHMDDCEKNRDPEVNDPEKPQYNTAVEENHKEQAFEMNLKEIREDMEKTVERMKELQREYLM